MKQPVSEALTAISRELRHLAELTSALQDQLSPRGYQDLDIEAFQSLDSLNQTLDCLAIFAAQVGALLPCQCSISIDDAAARICLGALAERLRGGAGHAPRVTAHEAELF